MTTLTEIHNPADLPDPGTFEAIGEPMVRLDIMVPARTIGDVRPVESATSEGLVRGRVDGLPGGVSAPLMTPPLGEAAR